MNGQNLVEQYRRVSEATHVLTGEGAFLAWLLLVPSPTTFIVVYEHWAHAHPRDKFHHMQFFHPLVEMRPEIQLIVYVIAHAHPWKSSTVESEDYRASLAQILPDLRYLRGALREPDHRRGVLYVTTTGVFHDCVPTTYKSV
jgi:hypothetical protein